MARLVRCEWCEALPNGSKFLTTVFGWSSVFFVFFVVNSFWILSLLNDIDGCLRVCASRLDGRALGFLVVLTSSFILFPLEVSVSTWQVEACNSISS